MTTGFVATTGGHLAQLHSLADRIPRDAESFWVTHANAQSTSLLADRVSDGAPSTTLLRSSSPFAEGSNMSSTTDVESCRIKFLMALHRPS